jgi:hypothetical protein
LPPIAAGDCNVGENVASRWCRTLEALDGFFVAGAEDGTAVALQFFPGEQCSETPPVGHNCCEAGACCGGASEAVPAVPLAELQVGHPALVDALNREAPLGVTTPIEPALRGIASWTAQNATRARSMAGVLITDGEPTGCNADPNALAALVAAHRAATGIPTFVIGMEGAKYAALETIAAAGGAPLHKDNCPAGIKPCHVYSVGAADSEVFRAALDQIRRSAVQCSYALPRPDAGVLDPSQLRVVVRGDSGELSLTNTKKPESCNAEGFWVDTDQGTVQLCPQACEELRNLQKADVRIVADCLGT